MLAAAPTERDMHRSQYRIASGWVSGRVDRAPSDCNHQSPSDKHGHSVSIERITHRHRWRKIIGVATSQRLLARGTIHILPRLVLVDLGAPHMHGCSVEWCRAVTCMGGEYQACMGRVPSMHAWGRAMTCVTLGPKRCDPYRGRLRTPLAARQPPCCLGRSATTTALGLWHHTVRTRRRRARRPGAR